MSGSTGALEQPALRLDHILTYAFPGRLEEHLDRYERAGFRIAEKTVRHDPGLRNGFVLMGREYLELCWVEDEVTFAKEGAGRSALRAAARPFGVALSASDITALRDSLLARGLAVPPMLSKSAADASGGRVGWTFQVLPPPLLPGLACTAIRYDAEPGRGPATVRAGRNGIYAIAGLILASRHPAARAARFRHVLAPCARVARRGPGYDLPLGPHVFTWLRPAHFERRYQLPWTAPPHEVGEIAALHVLSADLPRTAAVLQEGGWQTALRKGEPAELWVAPDTRDGVALVVTACAVDAWRDRHARTTGEDVLVLDT